MEKRQTRLPIIMQLTSMFGIVAILLLSALGYTIYNYLSLSTEATNLVNISSARTIFIKSGQINYARALLDFRGFLLYSDGT